MFTGWHCHVAAFFPTKRHKDNIAFLAANEAKDCAGNIAKVLLGEPHVGSSEITGEAAARAKKKTQSFGYVGSIRLANTNCLSCG